MDARTHFKPRKPWLEACSCTNPCPNCYDPNEEPARKLTWDEPDWLSAAPATNLLPVEEDPILH